MSYDILREAMKRFPEEICALKNKIGKIMILCDDIQTLERLIRCVRNKGIRIRGRTAYTLMDKWAREVYGKNNEVEFFLIDLYEQEKERRELTELLIKKGVFWRDVVNDAISAIYWDRDEDMLMEFARKSFKSKEFEGYVGEALEDLKFRGGNLREFLRFILKNKELIIGSCGKVLVKAIYDMLEEGERRKLWKKYEQELSNFGIKPEVRYEEINLRRSLPFSFAMIIGFAIGFAIGVYVGFQPMMKISNFITPIIVLRIIVYVVIIVIIYAIVRIIFFDDTLIYNFKSKLVKAIYNRLKEGERRKLERKYELELSDLIPTIRAQKEYVDGEIKRRILAFSFAMIIGFAIGIYVGENFQPIMNNFITPINQTNVTQPTPINQTTITQPSFNQTPSPPLSPLPSATPAPSPTPIVTVTYYSPTP